jgi:hypothetical protein
LLNVNTPTEGADGFHYASAHDRFAPVHPSQPSPQEVPLDQAELALPGEP